MSFLFDDFVRTDGSPARDDEGSFRFLNRAAGPYWERVRSLSESWVEPFPATDGVDVRQRFRGQSWGEHIGAWWELYLHALFQAMGFSVEVHPRIEGSRRRPDFQIQTDHGPILVEARHVQCGLTPAEKDCGRDVWVTSALNQLTHPRFTVGVTVMARGTEQPRLKAVQAGVLSWLDSLDADTLLQTPSNQWPRKVRTFAGWNIELQAIPTNRSTRAGRLVSLYPGVSGWDNTASALRSALKEKARGYGRPGKPFILAPLLTSGFTSLDEVVAALFGSDAVSLDVNDPGSVTTIRRPDGFWSGPHGPRGTRISAVLIGDAVTPWTVARRLPRLWLNPKAAHPLPSTFGLPTCQVIDGCLVQATGVQSSIAIFGLSSEWPGPEAPFD